MRILCCWYFLCTILKYRQLNCTRDQCCLWCLPSCCTWDQCCLWFIPSCHTWDQCCLWFIPSCYTWDQCCLWFIPSYYTWDQCCLWFIPSCYTWDQCCLWFIPSCPVGLVVKMSSSRVEDPGFESCLRQGFFGSSHTSDLKIGTPMATLPGAWHYRVSAWTGRPGVSILWLSEVESWICNFYLSVAVRVCADPSLRYTCMLLGR